MNGPLSQSAPDFRQWLGRFEAEWSSGQIPDVAGYLREAGDDDRQFIEDLIELDLECRWKQFDAESDPSSKDPHGFPLFPLVDDYASVLPESVRPLLFTPRCVAEEYRVRSRWGDKPAKDSFFERFSSNRTQIELALQEIDEEFRNEGIPISADSSLSNAAAARPTVILGNPAQKDSQLVPEENLKGTLVGKYTLEKRIGHGGFGEVWKAHDPDLKQDVAVKFPRLDKRFPQELLNTFRAEAQRLAALKRIPGIVDVLVCGEHDGKPYFVADFIEGESLEDRLKQQKKFPPEKTTELLAKIARTLQKAHEKDLVHRDIKPANILLDEDGEPYLADFGLAISEDEQFHAPDSIVGTYAYMSPEQARGESRSVDGRADIYSLGVILYRMLTGKLPYTAETSEQYIDKILNHKIKPPRQRDATIPKELERICLKCLEKDENERYSSAGELAKNLRLWNASDTFISLAIASSATLVLLLSYGIWRLTTSASRSPMAVTVLDATTRPKVINDVEPNNLLASKPTEAIFHHERDTNFWGWNSDLRQLQLRTADLSLISCGNINIESYNHISARFDAMSKHSRFGIFWGLQEQTTLEDHTLYVARCVYVECGSPLGEDQLFYYTLYMSYEHGFGYLIHDLTLHNRTTITSQPDDIWLLTLTFSGPQLTDVQIGDNHYFIDNPPLDADNHFTTGSTGIYTTLGDIIVKKFFVE